MSPKLTSFWRELSSAGQLSDFWLKCNWQHCFSCRFCLQWWSQLNFLWMFYFSGDFHDLIVAQRITTPCWNSKIKSKYSVLLVQPDSNVLKGSDPMFCASPHHSNVLSSQRIKSNILYFFVPIQKCPVFSKDQIQCSLLFAPIRVFYLLKGSNPILSASLH